MNWTQIKARCKLEILDDVCAVMSMLDNCLQIEDYSDIAMGMDAVYADLIDEELVKADKTVAHVSIYVPEEKNYMEYLAFLKERFASLSLDVTLEVCGVDEEEWATAWKKYYKPIKTGKSIVIVPEWEEYDAKENEIIVKMDPGMAFGTGTHETTRLCAMLLEKYMKSADRMLDVGTGSGILAVCGAKLGADKVMAYDIDPVAVRVAKENAGLNSVEDKIECYVSDLLRDVDLSSGEYDIVCANIVADVIIRMSKDINRYMKKGSVIITSGIITPRENDVVLAMEENGFERIDSEYENGWVAIVFRKN